MLIDAHCHLDFPELFDDLPRVLAAMREHGVSGALCVGVNLEDFPRVLALAEAHDALFASVGLHPEYDQGEEPDVARLVGLAAHPKVVAIGETGLDYHWRPERPEWQRHRFRAHIRAAGSAHKPLIIHTREAEEDTLRLLKEENAAQVGGVFHCFSGDWALAEQALSLGFYLSFSGIVTFKNARSVREVAARAPLDRVLVETDAPFLAPHPFRGKRNQPAYVRFVAEEIARLRGISLESLAQATSENFRTLFPETRKALS